MNRMLAGLAVLAATAAAMPALAQSQDDDWEFAQDDARKLAVAAVRYDGGAAIIIQCREGALTTLLAGVPRSVEQLKLQAVRADGRTDSQTWLASGANAFRSDNPARDARFMRGGGAFDVQTPEGAEPAFRTSYDLPTQSANLDQVLTACGWPMTDDRDALGRVPEALTTVDPNARQRRPERRRGAPSGGDRRAAPSPPGQRQPFPSESQISCIIRDMRLTECRPGHPETDPGKARSQNDLVSALNGDPVFGRSRRRGGARLLRDLHDRDSRRLHRHGPAVGRPAPRRACIPYQSA